MTHWKIGHANIFRMDPGRRGAGCATPFDLPRHRISASSSHIVCTCLTDFRYQSPDVIGQRFGSLGIAFCNAKEQQDKRHNGLPCAAIGSLISVVIRFGAPGMHPPRLGTSATMLAGCKLAMGGGCQTRPKITNFLWQ